MSFKKDISLNDQIKNLREKLLNNLLIGLDNETLPAMVKKYQRILINNLTFSNLSDDDIEFLKGLVE